MTDGIQQPPYFHGVVPFAWKGNRVYRVYTLPGELVFIYISGAGELTTLGSHFGLIGALISAAANPVKQNQQRLEQIDDQEIDQLVAKHKHSFRAQAVGMSDVSLDPRSAWLGSMYNQSFHVGVLRFTHAERGKMRLCIGSDDELKIAVKEVPAALADQVAVNVEWSERKNRFIAIK